MPRPEKSTVDYFQHDCIPKKTLYIIEQKYQNDGYAFWFKLLEMLGSTDGHFFDLNSPSNMEFLTSKTRLEESDCREVLDLLCKLEAIDCELWSRQVIWCQNFVDRLSHLYDKRVGELPVKPNFNKFPKQKRQINGQNLNKNGQKIKKRGVSDTGNTVGR